MATKETRPTIMSIGAHHDDNEIVAGTLARYQAESWRLVSVVMTVGSFIRGKSSRKYNRIREAESLNAAKRIGMKCVFLRFPEGDFQPTAEARRALVEQIRKYAPRIVITHPPHDYHTDHINTSRCTLEAVMQVGNCTIPTRFPPCPLPKLYYSDAWFVPFEPDTYVDISDLIELKLDMLRCHQSQLPPAGSNEPDMIEYARHQSRTRGIEAQVQYAEGFRFVPNLGSVRVSNLLS